LETFQNFVKQANWEKDESGIATNYSQSKFDGIIVPVRSGNDGDMKRFRALTTSIFGLLENRTKNCHRRERFSMACMRRAAGFFGRPFSGLGFILPFKGLVSKLQLVVVAD
jgi:hypothetical protein